MATFYFNAAVNNNWATLGNWWMNYNPSTDTHSVPATSLPTSADSIEVRGRIFSNSGSEPTVVNALFLTDNLISITVTGNCVFRDISYNLGVITGDCTFNDSSHNRMMGIINGDCTFNGSSGNRMMGTITGDCTFNGTSINDGIITGNCTFNGSSSNGGPNDISVVNGDCTFNDNAKNYYIDGLSILYIGTVNGNCTFSLSSAALHIDQALTKIKGSDSITGTIDFKYEKGINGSSILGIV